MVKHIPLQGDIIKINLSPKKGHVLSASPKGEASRVQSGFHPYICLSNKIVSNYANIAIFAPISNTKRSYPLYIPLQKTKTTGSVLLDQLVTIDYNARDYKFVETVPSALLKHLLSITVMIFQLNDTEESEELEESKEDKK